MAYLLGEGDTCEHVHTTNIIGLSLIGPEITSYIVEDYKATTLGEFVEEVLKERPHEWGYISFNGSFVVNKNRCEYADGKIKADFPNKSVLNEPIYYVLGDGGWSRMDYEVYNGQ